MRLHNLNIMLRLGTEQIVDRDLKRVGELVERHQRRIHLTRLQPLILLVTETERLHVELPQLAAFAQLPESIAEVL
jgi:hypothetical protein